MSIPATPGTPSNGGEKLKQIIPADHANVLATYSANTQQDVTAAIDSALAAKEAWADMPFYDRAAIFLRAAELVSSKYRFELMATTMLGQGKNAWQAEIDAAAELCDFFRYEKFLQVLSSIFPAVKRLRMIF